MIVPYHLFIRSFYGRKLMGLPGPRHFMVTAAMEGKEWTVVVSIRVIVNKSGCRKVEAKF